MPAAVSKHIFNRSIFLKGFPGGINDAAFLSFSTESNDPSSHNVRIKSSGTPEVTTPIKLTKFGWLPIWAITIAWREYVHDVVSHQPKITHLKKQCPRHLRECNIILRTSRNISSAPSPSASLEVLTATK